MCDVRGQLAAVHRCVHSVCPVACAVSWSTSLRISGVHARCVMLRVQCPRRLGSCLGVCILGAKWLRVPFPGPLGSWSPVRTLGVLCCVCSVLGHSAPVHRCARSVCYVARAVSRAAWLLFKGVHPRCVVFASAVLWATWLLFTGVHAQSVELRVRCCGPLSSCSPVCKLVVLCCVCGVLGQLAPVHRCAGAVYSVARALSWAS